MVRFLDMNDYTRSGLCSSLTTGALCVIVYRNERVWAEACDIADAVFQANKTLCGGVAVISKAHW